MKERGIYVNLKERLMLRYLLTAVGWVMSSLGYQEAS